MTDRVAPDENRCQFLFSNGNQCRDLREAGADHNFCKYHFARIQRDLRSSGDILDVSPEEILPPDAPLDSAQAVNAALTCVFRRVIEGRLPPRHAAALGYLGQLIISTLPGMTRESAQHASDAPKHPFLGPDPDAAIASLAHSLQLALSRDTAASANKPAPVGESATSAIEPAASGNNNSNHPSPATLDAVRNDAPQPPHPDVEGRN